MPLVAFSKLPTFQRLLDEHHKVLTLDKATHQDIRELHIGILNMMPDASLRATERQFMRLVGDCNQIVQFYVHLFTLPAIERGAEAQRWVDEYYDDFENIKKRGLDALIISGANPVTDSLDKEIFWPQLTEVIDWATDNVTSTLCACLATHAVVQYKYNIKRQPMKSKTWGVFTHRLTPIDHPLTRHMNTRFDVPHSRYNQITSQQLQEKGLIVLAKSEQVDFHLAVSADGCRLVFFQGHQEYDGLSLLKEYKREIDKWFAGTRDDYPPFPENYFSSEVKDRLVEIKSDYQQCQSQSTSAPDWPSQWLERRVDNTWRDTALSIFNNWLGMVYQLTSRHVDKPFMRGVDPNSPFEAQ